MASNDLSKKNPFSRTDDIENLSKKEAQMEIDDLRKAIEYHNYRYYVKNDPVISDEKYDRMFQRLQELEAAFPEFQTPISPTRRVGAEPVDGLKKVEHTAPILSLDSALEQIKIKNFDDFIRRHLKRKQVEYVAEPKLDGLSVEIVYEEGQFKYGATRGNGQTGEDISENLKTIGTVPLRLQNTGNLPAFLAVRGEVLMLKSGFQKLNKKRIEQGEEPFANPRNAAAGIVRQLDSKNVAGRPLEIFFYEILKSNENGFSSHWEVLQQFPKWGLKTNPLNKKLTSFDEIEKYREELTEKRDEIDYDIDGIVIKLDDLEQRKHLGTRQRNPRWAMAWKFPPKKEVTQLKDIVVQVGRTGMLTPVALLDPVNVGGVTVSRATLHNEDEIKKKDLRVGDKVRVIRAGDVIPEVAERVVEKGKRRSSPFSMPEECPVCGTKVVREGAYYFCPANLSCRAHLVVHIVHYASRDAMDIENLGEKVTEQLVDKEMVSDLADLYQLEVADLLQLEGFAEKSANKLYDAIQNNKQPRLDQFLYALGIRHVGQHVARVLANKYGSLDALQKADYDDLVSTPEIGPEIAESVHHFFEQKQNQEILQRLKNAGVKPQALEQQNKRPLEGKTFVFTGELENYTRREAEELIESFGGRAASSVSGNTDYVVVGENPGSKFDQAKKYEVRVLDEEEFERIVSEIFYES